MENLQDLSDKQEEHCLECETCLKVLQIVLDGEASQDEQLFVQQHIATCEHCCECYATDKELRDCIKSKIERLTVPMDLLSNIKIKIGVSAL